MTTSPTTRLLGLAITAAILGSVLAGSTGAVAAPLPTGVTRAVASVTAASVTAASVNSDCETVAILAFRGSGQDNLDPAVQSSEGSPQRYAGSSLVTNGWEGATLQRLIAPFATRSYADGFRADSVPVIGVGPADDVTAEGYPAIDPGWEVIGRLTASANDGAAAAQSIISDYKQASAGCANPTKFIAVGYSQGAMAARLTAQLNPTDVVGVVDLGDPYQMPDAAGNEGAGSGGNGFVRWNHPNLQNQWDAFYDLDAHKTALCHTDDPICDFRWGTAWRIVTGDTGPHTNYFDTAASGDVGTVAAAEVAAKSAELADLAHQYFLSAETDAPPAASVDVVFAIDTTGSMASYIGQARLTAQTVAEATLAASPGSRVGPVEYRDHGDGFVSRVVTPLTTDFDALTVGIGSLDADGGGDWPEAVYSGVVTAAGMDWRGDVARSIVLLGDAPAHAPEPVTGYTAASVIELLTASSFGAAPEARRAAPALPIVLYTLAAEANLGEQLVPIVAATGGLSLTLADADAVEAALTEALEDSVAAPIAAITVTPLATAGLRDVGLETVVSAVGSSAGDAALSYEFDLDADGVFETVSATGVARVGFDAAGPATLAVRVTDSRGRSSIAATTVDVAAPESLTARFDPTSSAVTVTATPGAAAAGSTVRLARDDAADDMAAAAAAGPVSLLVVPFGAGPWGSEPVVTVQALPADAAGDVQLPAGLAAGSYYAVLASADGSWGADVIEVTAAVGVPPVDPGADPDTDLDANPAGPAVAGAASAAHSAAATQGEVVAAHLGDELEETGTSPITALLIAAGLLLAGVAFLLVRRARGPRE